jgi:hypothetical protein
VAETLILIYLGHPISAGRYGDCLISNTDRPWSAGCRNGSGGRQRTARKFLSPNDKNVMLASADHNARQI